MASVLKVLLEFLRSLRSAGNHIKRFSGCCALILAFLGRRWEILRRLWDGKPGAFQKPRPTEPPIPGRRTKIRSALDGSADSGLREYVVAASSIPESANAAILQERASPETRERGAATPPGISPSPPASHVAHHHNERTSTNQSPESVNDRSSSNSSDRLPTIIRSSSREPLRAAVGQPSRRPSVLGVIHERPSQLSLPLSATLEDDFVLPEGRFLQLIHSEQFPRYAKHITIFPEESEYIVEPLTTNFPYFVQPNDHDCHPWIPTTHPNGALYFYDPERRLFTDTDMHNPIFKEELEGFYSYLQKTLRVDQLRIPSRDYDLVLDIMVTEDKRVQWSYYFACHETRCLFWLEAYDASYMLSELYGVESPAHIKYRLESLYWNHWSLFPVVFEGRRLPLSVYDELKAMLSYGCLDVMTSKFSTFPYDNDSMQRMIDFVQRARETSCGVEYYAAGTARLLSFFSHWKFLYFHGQKNARIARDQTVYSKPKHERSLLITLLSPALFLAPDAYLGEIQTMWTDEVIVETVLQSFMSKIIAEWQGLILWSTVILTVNVSFLAIPGVVFLNVSGVNSTSPDQTVIFTSSTQIASCLSIQASIGSIVIGLLLVRHSVTKKDEDPVGVSTYLYQNSHKIFGLEPLAIIFSLPWALLMWSMVIFSVALLLFCFTISNKSTRIATGTMSAVIAALVAWCIRTAWESGDSRAVRQDSLLTLRRAGGRLFARLKQVVLVLIPSRPIPPHRASEDVHSVHSMVDRQPEGGVGGV